jgi:hypothetical protein
LPTSIASIIALMPKTIWLLSRGGLVSNAIPKLLYSRKSSYKYNITP